MSISPLLEIASSYCLSPRLRTAPTVAHEEHHYSMDLRVAKWGPMPGWIAVFLNCRCQLWVCAVKRRRFPVGASPTQQPLQPEATGAVMEETKWLKPSVSVSRIGDSASVQAVTRVNAEQASKRTMRRPTRQPFRGRLIRLGEVERRVRPAAAPG